jgi:hypothetical protein
MFAEAGGGTISVPRIFKALTTLIRRAGTSLNSKKLQLVGVSCALGGIFEDARRYCLYGGAHPLPSSAFRQKRSNVTAGLGNVCS